MDKGSEVIKIVEWNLKGQGVCFIFRTAERTFPTAEYRLKAVSLYNYISLSDIIMMPIVI